jgi:hypothetical protein
MNTDQPSVISTLTEVPRSVAVTTWNLPPASSERSLMMVRPQPEPVGLVTAPSGKKPLPSSVMLTRTKVLSPSEHGFLLF